ncbi:hypothetical protein OC844_002747 [Tilletia horrida]|nr:hypothetical protein OC844_002747 [Tilletia horrida]
MTSNAPATLSDGTSAAKWAVYTFMPQHYFDVAIGVITVIIPVWEYLNGLNFEYRVWRRLLLQRNRPAPRLLRPMAVSILLLRYLSILFTLAWTLPYLGHSWSTAQCKMIWPLCVACSTALCWCTAVVLTLRIMAYLAPAIQSQATFYVVRALLFFFLAVMLAASITSWTMTDDLAFTVSIHGLCANDDVGRFAATAANEPQMSVGEILNRRSMLLLNFACVLLHDCIVTFFACWIFGRIRRQLIHGTALVSMLITNSMQYFVSTASCAVFCIVWFAKQNPNVSLFNLNTSISAVLAIRMLSSEFLYTEHSACLLSDIDQTLPVSAPLGGRLGGGAARIRWEHYGDKADAEAVGGGEDGVASGHAAAAQVARGALAAAAAAGQPSHHHTALWLGIGGGGGGRRRFGHDLTDIEAVPVCPHGRTLERPEPVWLDDAPLSSLPVPVPVPVPVLSAHQMPASLSPPHTESCTRMNDAS